MALGVAWIAMFGGMALLVATSALRYDGAVTDHPVTATFGLEPDRTTRPSTVPPRSSAAPTVTPRTAQPSAAMTPATVSDPLLVVAGVATWFHSPAGVSAAGPALRAALGPDWRGERVTVCAGARCVDVVLGDWCACGDRPSGPTVIDLHAPDFAALAPLSRGVVPVEVWR